MFYGEVKHALDIKGRLIVPAQFREGLLPEFVMTKGLDHSIFVFPQGEWRVMEEKLRALPLTHRDARAFVRYFFSGAHAGTVDKQGRIRIPQNLMEYAGLTKQVMIIGVGSRLELWSEEQWQNYNNDEQLSYDNIAEKLADLGI
ncbi:MAG: division/cell wall cluster transcriptional repressor MraZ [Tissierellia bacterium]|nr:division/cell wall cluster transcriptional repressor MraZ [Tissierellia bacterium]